MEEQGNQTQEKRSYENSPWINVYDWQITEHTNGQTGEPFWDIKLASNTFIEKDGQKLDVSHHHFHTNYEPSFTTGERGAPRCKRGIHFPDDWKITLVRYENTAPAGETPVFKETNRIEDITPKQIADGLAERHAQWRSSQEREAPAQAKEAEAAPQKTKAASQEQPKPYIHHPSTEPNLDCIYENDISAALISLGFASLFNPLGEDCDNRATVVYRAKGAEAQVHVSTILLEKDGKPFLDFEAPGGTALIATDPSGKDVLFVMQEGNLEQKFQSMERKLEITPLGEKRGELEPPFSLEKVLKAQAESAATRVDNALLKSVDTHEASPVDALKQKRQGDRDAKDKPNDAPQKQSQTKHSRSTER